MIIPAFKRETDIENYITNDFNIQIYRDLTDKKGGKVLFDPLDFLNLLYQQKEIVVVNKEKPLSISKHLLRLPLDKGQRSFFFIHLFRLLDEESMKNLDSQLLTCRKFISNHLESYEADQIKFESSELYSRNSKPQLYEISENYSLDYFTNKDHIPNQNLVNETIRYFKSGPGSRAFKPLQFLNLFEKQYRFVVKNWADENIVITQLKSLPLTELEKHILYGLILKWFGGYPIYSRMETDIWVYNTKKAIEREFLNYPEVTPEIEFCKADRVRRTASEMMAEAFNDCLNYGTDVEKTLEVLGYYDIIKKKYSSFDALFEDAYKDGLIKGIESREQFLNSQTKHRFHFKLWLENDKGWIDRDEDQYDAFLTMETLIEFLEFQKGQLVTNQGKLIKNNEQPDNKTIIPIETLNFDKEIAELKAAENLFWKGLPMEAVINHFLIMTTKLGANGRPYLTNQQLVLFLKKGFLNHSGIAKQKFDCSTTEKGFIIKRFYELYDLAASKFGHPNKKKQFVNLFIDCFDNWDQNTIQHFFKPNKVRQKW